MAPQLDFCFFVSRRHDDVTLLCCVVRGTLIIIEEPTKNETVIMLLSKKRNRHFGSCWEHSPELLRVRDCGLLFVQIITLFCSRWDYRHASVTCSSCVCNETAVRTNMAASTMPVAMDTHLVRLRIKCRASYSAVLVHQEYCAGTSLVQQP